MNTALPSLSLARLLGLCCAAGLFAPGIASSQSTDDGFAPNPDGPVHVIAVDAQGKIIIGGAFATVDGANRSHLARLHGDGTVDDAFNAPANDSVSAVAVQADGKILVGGEFGILGGQPRSGLARLHADGRLDLTFDPGANDEVYCLQVQADGKILAGGGFTTLGGSPREHVGRLNMDGSLDTGFNPGANDGVSSFAMQPDGKILVGGLFTTLGGQPRSNLGRLNSDGSLDATFTPGTDGAVSSLAVQADGEILVGGAFTTLGGLPRARIGRLHPNGSLDTGFNPGANEYVSRLAVQTDGTVLVGGRFTTLGGSPREHVGRLNPDGSLEIGFNPGANNWVTSFALETGGRILVGGFFTTLGGQPRSRLGRLNADPLVRNCSSRGNCHAIYVTYNKPVRMNGTYSVTCSNTAGVDLVAENFNAGDGGFTVDTPIPYEGPWVWNAGAGSWTQAGQNPENSHANTSTLISPPINVHQSGIVHLTFSHRYSFENGNWDGGAVQVSVNNGPFTTVPANAFSQNAYNGAVLPNSASLLRGQSAFVNNSPDFANSKLTSVCSLGVYQAGDSISVAFIAASDTNIRGDFQPNWEIDSLLLRAFGSRPVTVTGVTYGESSNVVCLAVSPELVPDINTYYVTIRDLHDTEAVVINPNPTICPFVHGAEYPSFSILYKRFDDVGNGNLAAFLASSKFVNGQPDVVLADPTGFFETPTNVRDNYGAQIFGVAIAPYTGDYRFWMSSHDQGATYLATDAVPAHKLLVNREPEWGGVRRFAQARGADDPANPNGSRGIPPVNGSAPIHLLAGQKVYLEGLITAGGGGDNYALAMTINDPNPPANGSDPIRAHFFRPMLQGPNGEIFSRLCDVFCNPGPSDQTAFIGDSATFDFVPDGTPPYTIQWKKNGVLIPGATGTSYTTPPATAADDGTVFCAFLNNAFSSTNCCATQHVSPPVGGVIINVWLVGYRIGLRFTGIPGRIYYVERAHSVTGPWPDRLAAITMPIDGVVDFVDTTDPVFFSPQSFYRTSTD